MRFSENYHYLSPNKANPYIAVFSIIILLIQAYQHGALKNLRGIQKINAVLLNIFPAFTLIPCELHGLNCIDKMYI